MMTSVAVASHGKIHELPWASGAANSCIPESPTAQIPYFTVTRLEQEPSINPAEKELLVSVLPMTSFKRISQFMEDKSFQWLLAIIAK